MDENTQQKEIQDGSSDAPESEAKPSAQVPVEIESQVERIDQAIKEVPEEHREEVMSLVMERVEVYHGPPPHPRIIRGYEAVAPGSAEKIINTFQEQVTHRMDMEHKTVEAEIQSERRGQWMGFTLTMAFIVISAFLLMMGKSIEGFLTLGGTGSCIIGLFIYGRYQAIQGERKQ